jgi:thioredoxin 1
LDTALSILTDKKFNCIYYQLFSEYLRIRFFKGENMSTEPIHVTDAAFETTVLKSTTPVIVDFWAPWCGPCRAVAPILDKIAKEYDGKIVVAKVNTDENPEWAQRFGVQGIPTMLFVANGKVLHTQVGALPEPILRDILTQFLDVAENKN